MSDNTIKNHEGNTTDIYESDMQYYADEYVNQLHDKDLIYSTRGNAFTGLIKYINRYMEFNNNIYDDINTLNYIWNIYVELCYKYNQNPTLEEYCLLIGCSRSTLYSWMNEETRAGDYCEKLGSSRSDTIKKWGEECKLGRYKSAASGNVGGIFLCKAVDGMVETAPVQVANQEQHRSIEQIRQDHGIQGIEQVDAGIVGVADEEF